MENKEQDTRKGRVKVCQKGQSEHENNTVRREQTLNSNGFLFDDVETYPPYQSFTLFLYPFLDRRELDIAVSDVDDFDNSNKGDERR